LWGAIVTERREDAGLECFSLLLRYHGLAVDPTQIQHRSGAAAIGVAEMLRCAREFHFKTKLITADWPRLISLDRTQMQVEDKMINLSSGMAVTVEIKTGSRRIIEYLLSPLLRYKHESLRER
jgi:ABC-type bacteriocin/lantibiotic exporter with double-glycine peptidase domain